MAWDKAYPEAGIPWDNDNSPYLNETNMGIIDEALKTHDERIIELYGTRQTVAGYADAAQTAEINALAYSNNAQAQAVNSQVSAAYSQAEADRSKAEADRAFSGTPEGYDVLVEDVAEMKTTIPVIQGSVEALETNVDAIKANVGFCTNIFKAILGTTTSNGITLTANSDGTYTANGTATADTEFSLGTYTLNNQTLKLVGCPSNGSAETYYMRLGGYASDYGNGCQASRSGSLWTNYITINIKSGTVCNNLVFKPMLTENLNATYDDFVSYSGSGKTLAENVGNSKMLISDEWQNKGYSKGDYVIYQNTLYVCILTHSSAIVPTNATYWQATNLNNALKLIESGKIDFLVCSSSTELEGIVDSKGYNYAYIGLVLSGAGLTLGFRSSSTYHRQIRITHFDNHIYSRVKANSSTWTDWVTLV